MTILPTLLLAAALTAPATTSRQPFPDDYKPSPCVAGKTDCLGFRKEDLADIAAIRGYTIDKNWLSAHWEELRSAFAPYCAKAAACYGNPANGHLWCNDVVRDGAYSICDRLYAKDSSDHQQCRLTSVIFWFGVDRTSKARWQEIHDCAIARPSSGERTLDLWMVPEQFDASYGGKFLFHALDSETHIPVQAHISIEGTKRFYAPDSADGKPTAGIPIPWEVKWKRVANSAGHQDLAPPIATITAPGYRTVTFPMPLPTPKLDVTMKPAALRPGRNEVVVEVRDATTGTPVEMRVMGGTRILGRSNVPFVVEIPAGEKMPEIWITSLYDKYGDVVVAPAK